MGETGPADFENIKELETLENSLKETLRLRCVLFTQQNLRVACAAAYL
jgi:hypothetical protein